jgi:hypothetical protein
VASDGAGNIRAGTSGLMLAVKKKADGRELFELETQYKVMANEEPVFTVRDNCAPASLPSLEIA